jgi:hypothetical protein
VPRPNITPRLSLKVMDMRVAAPDAEAVRAVRDAAVAIERTFTNGSDWRSVVGHLRLMVKILEDPPRTCKTCGAGFRVENGVAFALMHRGLALARHCEACRDRRRQERHRRGEAGRTGHRTDDAAKQADGRGGLPITPLRPGKRPGQAS